MYNIIILCIYLYTLLYVECRYNVMQTMHKLIPKRNISINVEENIDIIGLKLSLNLNPHKQIGIFHYIWSKKVNKNWQKTCTFGHFQFSFEYLCFWTKYIECRPKWNIFSLSAANYSCNKKCLGLPESKFLSVC